jgi:uncharacterized protein HemY
MQYLDTQLRARQFDNAIAELTDYLSTQDTPQPRLEKRLFLAREHQINFKLAAAQDEHNISLIDQLRKQNDQLRIEQIQQQVDRSPNDLQLRFDYAKILFDCREWKESLTQFQHAIHHRKRRIRALIYSAELYQKLNQPDHARTQLQTALAELPDTSREKTEIESKLQKL